MEKITGINFIDKDINKRGLRAWIKLFGKNLLILGGVILALGLMIYAPAKHEYLSRWTQHGVPPFITNIFFTTGFIITPVLFCLIGIGFMKIKRETTIFALFACFYIVVMTISGWIVHSVFILPNVMSQFKLIRINIGLFRTAIVNLLPIFIIYFVSRKQVKEQFKLK